MKIRIVIDDKLQDIDVESFEMAYNKYEGIDFYIMVTSKTFLNTLKGDDTNTTIKTEAIGVGKPSSAGILLEENMFENSIPVNTLFSPEDNVIQEVRHTRGVRCVDNNSKKEYKSLKETTIRSDDITFSETNFLVLMTLVKEAIYTLVSREKTFVGDYFLYEVKEPVIVFRKTDFDKKTRVFYVTEEVAKIAVKEEGKSLENNSEST